MQIYFGICLALMLLIYFKVYAEIVEFKKAHPHAKVKSVGWAKNLCNLMKVGIIMCIPLLNIALFFMIFCYFDNDKWEQIIWDCCEGTPIE